MFQLWQQIFKDTFQQYRRVSCSLLDNENEAAVFELWHDYLAHVRQFLRSPVPGDYRSLTGHERLCQVHREVLIGQTDAVRPDVVAEPAALGRLTDLVDLHAATMTELDDAHRDVCAKLTNWRQYRADVKAAYEWLWKAEKAHSDLNLKFINVRRLPHLKTQINVSTRCPRPCRNPDGWQLVGLWKKNKRKT